MIDEGYEFVKQDRREYVLLDTPNNRQLLTTLVKTKFPSLEITKWENHCLRNHDGFQLRSFECYIRNLTELKELIPKMNQLTPNGNLENEPEANEEIDQIITQLSNRLGTLK